MNFAKGYNKFPAMLY